MCNTYPHLSVIIDTRPAQFHAELDAICSDYHFMKERVKHIHINDYHGGYMDWDALYPILPPGQGDVPFQKFFTAMGQVNYEGSYTLEAPSMRENTVAYDEINGNLQYIRTGILQTMHGENNVRN